MFIGGCGATDPEHIGTFGWLGGGHTHMCDNDPLRNHICISSREYIIPELVYHEYAHVLMKRPYTTVKCISMDQHEIKFYSEKDKEEWNDGHNKEWSKLIQQFGFEPRKYIPYVGA